MAANLLGRTNRAFPPVWLSLSLPRESSEDAIPNLVAAARAANVPLDVSNAPALWGGQMRGADDSTLIQIGNADYERATSSSHALDLVQAHLIETLSAIGREWIDFYFLRVRRMAEEYQIAGALEAMELARQEGHIRYLGICCDGPPLATIGVWQFHDAFDVLLVPRNHHDSEAYDTLAPMASERRTGIITTRPLNWGFGIPFTDLEPNEGCRTFAASAAVQELAQEHPVLLSVRSESEVVAAMNPAIYPPVALDGFKLAFNDDERWASLAGTGTPYQREAAKRRALAAT